MNNKLGIYLQTLRKQHHYTQAFIAQQIGVIRQTYSHYETGRVQPPMKILYRLADLYGIEMESLLDLISERKEEKQQNECMELYRLTKSEHKLILTYRKLDERASEDVFEVIAMLAKKKNKRMK